MVYVCKILNDKGLILFLKLLIIIQQFKLNSVITKVLGLVMTSAGVVCCGA
jgi:hypothetical protein